jgi:hypothetical protein
MKSDSCTPKPPRWETGLGPHSRAASEGTESCWGNNTMFNCGFQLFIRFGGTGV